MNRTYYVYIMASGRNGTLYIGITNNLIRRAWEHREGLLDGFTKRYGVKALVWYELYETVNAAIRRETRLKKWPRKWKLDLIETNNPEWCDLVDTLQAQ